MSKKQKTIKNSVSLTGAGLHTGQDVTVTFRPAPVDHGFTFKRVDLEGDTVIQAIADNVTDTNRGTSLKKGDFSISTVEHVLAAISGLDIDNILIELDGPEIPILDGSSRLFVEKLIEAGFENQEKEREYIELNRVISWTDPENGVEMIAVPCDHFKVSVMIDFNTKVLNTQHAKLEKVEDFKDEIAPSRTFVFLHELEQLIQYNLIKGGDLSNAIVFVNRIISQEELDRLAKFFNKPKIEVLEEGILNNLKLHHHNEPARHKLLDVVGDLSLVGKPLKAHIIASKPGHSANVKFARKIRDEIKKGKRKGQIPSVDFNKPPLYDINAIKKILPHRPPFLLVDKILEMTNDYVIGMKNVTMNESFFVGHFPYEPVMPGVLQVESMAQAGGILVLNTVPDPEDYVTYFIKIEDAKFRRKVIPGDVMIFKLDLISPIRRGIAHMKGVAYVGDKIVMEATLMAQIVKKQDA